MGQGEEIYWHLRLGDSSKLGWNITFLEINLWYYTGGFFPDRDSSFCIGEEYLNVYFYLSRNIEATHFQHYGPYCGHHPQWSLFSTAFCKITMKTKFGYERTFELLYQAMDLGSILTQSVFEESASWITQNDQRFRYYLSLNSEPYIPPKFYRNGRRRKPKR